MKRELPKDLDTAETTHIYCEKCGKYFRVTEETQAHWDIHFVDLCVKCLDEYEEEQKEMARKEWELDRDFNQTL